MNKLAVKSILMSVMLVSYLGLSKNGIAESDRYQFTYTVRTHFGGDIARSISQLILSKKYQSGSDFLSLVENKNRYGSWSLTVYNKSEKLAEVGYSLNSLRDFPSAKVVAQYLLIKALR